MKIKFLDKGKIKKIASYMLVGGMLLSPLAANAETYVVQKGDTLTGISQRKYGTIQYFDELAYLNNIENPSFIRAGDVLYLPDDVRELDFCGQDDYGYVSNIVYHEFTDSDTLWRLAKDYYGNGEYWKPLAYYNNIDDPKKIANGTVIYLPDIETLKEIRVGNYPMDLYTMSKKYYGTSKYANILANYNHIEVYGMYNPSYLSFPALEEMVMYYENGTYVYPADGRYIVRRNDTIKKIANLVYEDESYADFLLEINGLSKKDIKEGIVLYIPCIVREYTK